MHWFRGGSIALPLTTIVARAGPGDGVALWRLGTAEIHLQYKFNRLPDGIERNLLGGLCPAGRWSIGYGHTDGVNRGMLITEKTADAFLKQDIKHAEQAVNEVDADLTQEQFDALVSFVFNIGTQAFRVSTLRKLVERNPNDPKIADEFRRWVYAGDKKLPGLIKRREQEIKLYYS